MTLDARLEDAAVKVALSSARRDIGIRTKEGLLKGAERVLPAVRSDAPDVIAAYLTAKSTTKGAFITTRGPKVYDRIAGLLEYGGTVRTAITPTKALALKIGNSGDFVASVTTPRTYQGQDRIKNAVQARLPIAEAAARDGLIAAFGTLGL